MDPTSSTSLLHSRRRRTTTTTNNNNHRRSASSPPPSWCCTFKNHPGPPPPQTPQSKPKPKPKPKPPLPIMRRIPIPRIHSPGRVSPIPEIPKMPLAHLPATDDDDDEDDEEDKNTKGGGGGGSSGFDVRLRLKGRKGGRMMRLEMDGNVLVENSPVFAELIGEYRGKMGNVNNNNNNKYNNVVRIEVPEVRSFGVFRFVIELMFEIDEDGIMRLLGKIGVCRVVDVLEISASIKFDRGVSSCLKYLEAIPWSEREEEKIRRLFTKLKFDGTTETTAQEILARLHIPETVGPQRNLPRRLLWSITACENARARNELKSLARSLLCQPVCENDHFDIKEDLYSVSRCCISALVTLFEESSGTGPESPAGQKPSAETISWQVDNITWLLEILLELQMAEDFVDLWTDQKELIRLHGLASPLIRYQLSRVSAVLFIAIGTRKLHCRTYSRSGLLHSWFGPMLLDFGWIQRCRKGLDAGQLEEAMGQALLTLPLKEQDGLFMEWLTYLSGHGTECPNLSRAVQVWWRRTSSRD